MGGRGPGPGYRLRAVLAFSAVGCLAFAALALRPDGAQGLWGARGPLTSYGWLLGLLFAAGGIAVAVRYRTVLRETPRLEPVTERLTTAATVVLRLAVVVTPLFLIVLSAKSCEPGATVEPPPPSPPPTTGPPREPTGASPDTSLVEILVSAIGVVLLLVMLTVLGIQVRRWLAERRRRRRAWLRVTTKPAGPDGKALAEAVASGRRALAGSDARTAVIACYLAMEDSLADSGVTRHDSDSPADLLRRAATAGVLTGSHPATLAGLFREARYSSHPMGEPELARARAALDGIAAQLGHDARQSAPTEEAR
ncbi:DUF4129 domain-containing protein [Kitasatospora sp. NPDC096147]|uniref:DUF4129 domain-containing protein n=1 Tax=Kitasatospora sp. NPDC096147 TaxID=3364093 RepID=UPI0038207BAD